MNSIVGAVKHTSHKTSRIISIVLSRFSTLVTNSTSAESKRCIAVQIIQDRGKDKTKQSHIQTSEKWK